MWLSILRFIPYILSGVGLSSIFSWGGDSGNSGNIGSSGNNGGNGLVSLAVIGIIVYLVIKKLK